MDRNIRKRPRVHRHLLRLPEGHIVEVLKDPKKGCVAVAGWLAEPVVGDGVAVCAGCCWAARTRGT
jgi:hypothetical protein